MATTSKSRTKATKPKNKPAKVRSQGIPKRPSDENPGMVDIAAWVEKRTQRSPQDRRKAKRFFLSSLFPLFCASGKDILTPVDLLDASEGGLAIKMPLRHGATHPAPKDELQVRFYFSADTYLLVDLVIANTTMVVEGQQRFFRVGCRANPKSPTYETFVNFVKFIESYSRTFSKGARKAPGIFI